MPLPLFPELITLGQQARSASIQLATLSTEKKNQTLRHAAALIRAHADDILAANAQDITLAEQKGTTPALLDRLRLSTDRIESMAHGLEHIATLPDPVGDIMDSWTRPNGLKLEQKRVPIGVIGIIYESRPNVTVDAAALCLKTGNAVLLKGGSDALQSNTILADILNQALRETELPEASITLIKRTERTLVPELCRLSDYIDLLIPRGGRSLIETVVEYARMPVIKHYDGICHTYFDKDMDNHDLAFHVIHDAKTQKPAACNALETLLIHEEKANLLPRIAEALSTHDVRFYACSRALEYLPKALAATEDNWRTEYLDYALSIKIVDSLEEAITHINTYGSHHSDAILTHNPDTANRFLNNVHSACVYHNASTRFSDGEEFGFGAEMGISTDKIHARGPMGLRELTTYKYLISGSGQTKGSYA